MLMTTINHYEDGVYVLLSDDYGGINLIGPFPNQNAASYYGERWEMDTGLASWRLISDPSFIYLKP